MCNTHLKLFKLKKIISHVKYISLDQIVSTIIKLKEIRNIVILVTATPIKCQRQFVIVLTMYEKPYIEKY